MAQAEASRHTVAKAGRSLAERVDRFFQVAERGSTLGQELRGGVAGWVTMSYILLVNAQILSEAPAGGSIGMEDLVTATAISSAAGTLLVGLAANVPFGVIPGMGVNAYLVHEICKRLGVPLQQGLSSGLVSGAVLALLWLTGATNGLVRRLLSEHLKKAITASIGAFQALIGFKVMGLVVGSPDTLVTLGSLAPSWSNAHLYLALAGFLLVAGVEALRVRGSVLIGITAMAAFSWISGLDAPPAKRLAAPSLGAALAVDFSGWLPGSPALPGLAAGAAALLFVAMFDVAGVQHGMHTLAGLPMDERRSRRVMGIVGLSTVFGSLCGTSPIILAAESGAAITQGARTGAAAVVMAGLFLLSALSAPVICAMPREATAVPLILVGSFMMAPCRGIAWDDVKVAVPSFLTLVLVPFTYCIHNGIIAGMLMDGYFRLLTWLAGRLQRARSKSGGAAAAPDSGKAAGGDAELGLAGGCSPAAPAGSGAADGQEEGGTSVSTATPTPAETSSPTSSAEASTLC